MSSGAGLNSKPEKQFLPHRSRIIIIQVQSHNGCPERILKIAVHRHAGQVPHSLIKTGCQGELFFHHLFPLGFPPLKGCQQTRQAVTV